MKPDPNDPDFVKAVDAEIQRQIALRKDDSDLTQKLWRLGKLQHEPVSVWRFRLFWFWVYCPAIGLLIACCAIIGFIAKGVLDILKALRVVVDALHKLRKGE